MPHFRLVRDRVLCLLTVGIAACSSGGNSSPDADLTDAVPTGPCVEFLAPSAVLNTYPVTHDGNILGAGADHSVDSMACTTELTYFAPGGEELVVRLDDLTPGTSYALKLDSPEDLAFYVTLGCTDGDIAAGDCLLFSDASPRGTEVAAFTAPDSGRAYVVVDHFVSPNPLTDGSFSLDAYERECEVNADCSADAASPFCSDLRCVPCTTSFHCDDPALPVCDNDLKVCIPGHDQCTGDDPKPPENGDDGPAGAVVLTPTDLVPAVANAKICALPNTGSDILIQQDAEVDFYKFDLLADEKRGVSLTWASNANDLDLYLFDATGAPLQQSFFGATAESLIIEDRDPGTYYLAVAQFDDSDPISLDAIDYTLSLTFPECDTNFDCLTAEKPVCGPALVCEEPSDQCSTDDASEPNDGPANATPLISATLVTGLICNTPATERDYYSITVADGDSLDVVLAYTDAANVDLDVLVLSSDGTLFGTSFWRNPELVKLTFLPAGTYFLEVRNVGSPTAVAHAYDLTATVTAALACATPADCAAEFSTQVYRGSCQAIAEPNAGACIAIEGAEALALGVACDSGDDCTTGLCSNLIFQSGADASVCTIPCVADTTCTDAGAHGPGFSCTIPFTNNKCHPDCAGDLDCGAVTNFDPPDDGQPWDYLTCNVGVCELSM